jgi:hypothetical protein
LLRMAAISGQWGVRGVSPTAMRSAGMKILSFSGGRRSPILSVVAALQFHP